VETMFFERIFKIVIEAEEERNKVNVWDCACSLSAYKDF